MRKKGDCRVPSREGPELGGCAAPMLVLSLGHWEHRSVWVPRGPGIFLGYILPAAGRGLGCW